MAHLLDEDGRLGAPVPPVRAGGPGVPRSAPMPETTTTVTTYPLFQHAYVVRDLDASAQRWSEMFGAGPFAIREHHVAPQFDYRGSDVQADVSYAFGYLGDLMVQLIQMHDDAPSIYREMYGRDEEGFHHVACLVHDFAAARQHFLDLGFALACQLWTGGVDAAYFDTRAVTGGFTEIHGDPPYILETFAAWRQAHVDHRPGEDPILSRSGPSGAPPT
jgi:glyoxalase/bleomycin resistance protein/dioxygenase superfamily protein